MHLPKWWYIVYELQRTVGMDTPPPEQPQENTGKYKSPALPRKKKDIFGSVDLFLFLNGFWFFLVKLLQYTDNYLVWFSKPVNIYTELFQNNFRLKLGKLHRIYTPSSSKSPPSHLWFQFSVLRPYYLFLIEKTVFLNIKLDFMIISIYCFEDYYLLYITLNIKRKRKKQSNNNKLDKNSHIAIKISNFIKRFFS